jgi:hypothetical protein
MYVLLLTKHTNSKLLYEEIADFENYFFNLIDGPLEIIRKLYGNDKTSTRVLKSVDIGAISKRLKPELSQFVALKRAIPLMGGYKFFVGSDDKECHIVRREFGDAFTEEMVLTKEDLETFLLSNTIRLRLENMANKTACTLNQTNEAVETILPNSPRKRPHNIAKKSKVDVDDDSEQTGNQKHNGDGEVEVYMREFPKEDDQSAVHFPDIPQGTRPVDVEQNENINRDDLIEIGELDIPKEDKQATEHFLDIPQKKSKPFDPVEAFLDVWCYIPKEDKIDEKLKIALQLLAGAAIFGKPDWVKKFFIIYGISDVGKTSFMDLCQGITDSKAVARVSDNVWLNPTTASHHTELLKLIPAKLPFSSESDDKNQGTFQLGNAAMVKRMCGEKEEVFRPAFGKKELTLMMDFLPVHLTNNPLRTSDLSLAIKIYILVFQNDIGVAPFLEKCNGIANYARQYRKQFLLWAIQGAIELFSNPHAFDEFTPESSKIVHQQWFKSANKRPADSKLDENDKLTDMIDHYIMGNYEKTGKSEDVLTSQECFAHFQNVTGLFCDKGKSTLFNNAMTRIHGQATHGRIDAYRTGLRIKNNDNSDSNASKKRARDDPLSDKSSSQTKTKSSENQPNDDKKFKAI